MDLGSGLLHHECAGYCSLRGEAFSEAKCQAFYVDTTVFPRQCHMVPPSKAGETATSAFKFTYFDKQVTGITFARRRILDHEYQVNLFYNFFSFEEQF